MHDYDIYLFDWDGTLADSTAVWLRAVRRQFEVRGLHPTDAEIIRALGDWNNMLALGMSSHQLTEARAAARNQARAEVLDAPLFEGVRSVLYQLKQKNKKVAVVTALHRQIIDSLVAHHGYDQLFDTVVSGDDVQHLKPHPEALQLAMEKLKRQPREKVLMLGDTDRDILAAHQAGVDSLLFFPPEHRLFHDLEILRGHKPTHIITHWKEFES